MTPKEAADLAAKAEGEAKAMAKYRDGTAVITDEDVPYFDGDQLLALMNVGRLQHFHIGADPKRRR